MRMKAKLMILIILGVLPLLISSTAADESESEGAVVLSREKRKILFFPQYTILQLSMCLIAQVSAITSHRLAVNHGFQINYQLPFNVSSYYSPVFWARKFSKSSNMMIDFFERIAASDDIAGSIRGEESDEHETTTLAVEEEETTTKESIERRRRMIQPDMSAGQFYASIIETMTYAGYHEDCLLKSVCELAKIPIFYEDDMHTMRGEEEEDVVSELLHFVLTPSLHRAFDTENEIDDRELYEEAEQIGKEGGDCEAIYTECKISPLHTISNFISIESHQ